MVRLRTAIIVVGTLLAATTAAWETVIINHCPYDIHWRISIGSTGDTNPMSRLGPGGHRSIFEQPRNLAIKVNKSGDWNRVLQAEAHLNAPGATLWYNWSDEAGNDFIGDHRGMYFAGRNGCKNLACGPSDNSCNWKAPGEPNIGSCRDPGYAEIVFC